MGEAVPLGIAAGLFVGKPAGIMSFTWVSVKLGLAKLPEKVDWWLMAGVAGLGGIGFTMSLFIGSLAFEHSGPDYDYSTVVRLGIIVGSLLSGVVGYAVLRYALRRQAKGPNPKPAKSKTVTFDE